MLGRSWIYMVIALLLAGCAGGSASRPVGPASGSPAAPAATGTATVENPVRQPDPAPSPKKPDQAAPAPSPSPSPPAEPAREEIPGGFRVGGPAHLWFPEWLDNQRLQFRFSRGQEYLQASLEIGGGPIATGPVPSAQAGGRFFMSEHRSPDGTRTVGYGKSGPGLFIDLRSGAEHGLQAPGFYGSTVFDSWAPDGSRYLVQAPRSDPVPGFYFLDGTGQPAGSFHEPGHYSLWSNWSPDSQMIAFLSVPIGVKYPTSPEGWDEQPFGPRVGLLEVRTGKARYFTLGEGQAAFGRPVWSPDSARVAFACGELVIEEIAFASGPSGKHKVTSTVNNRVCEVDLRPGSLRRVTEPQGRNTVLQLSRYTPDGAAVLATRHQDRGPDSPLPVVISLADGRLFELSGEAVLVVGQSLAVVEPVAGKVRLILTDLQGKVLRTLAEGVHIDEVKASPDGRHLAFRVYTERSGSLGPTMPCLVVLAVTGPGSSR